MLAICRINYTFAGSPWHRTWIGSFRSRPPALIWHFSESAPIGLYRVLGRHWIKGDRVAIRPDLQLSELLVGFGALEPGQLLIKRVVAGSGDVVCRLDDVVTLDGAPVARAL